MTNKIIDELTKYCQNDDVKELKTYLSTKVNNELIINDIFIICCMHGKLQIVKWVVTTYSKSVDLDYGAGILKTVNMDKLNILEYLLSLSNKYETDFYYDYTDIFVFCCFYGFLDAAKLIYATGKITINNLYNTKTKKIKKYGLIKHINVIIFLNINYKYETTSITFCNSLTTKNLTEFKKYYDTHYDDIILSFDNHYIYFCAIEYNKYDYFTWLFSLYIPPTITIIVLFNYALIQNHQPFIDFLNNHIKTKKLMSQNIINDMYEEFIEDEEYNAIKSFYNLGHKMTTISLVYNCAAAISALGNNDGFFKIFYTDNTKIFEKNIVRKFSMLMYLCEIGNVDDFIWLYEKLQLCKTYTDQNYIKFINSACETFNLPIANWLANLYGHFEIEYVRFNYQDFLIFVEVGEMKKLYKQISNGDLTTLQKYKKLKITNYVENDKDANCLICLEKQDDMIQLCCGHYSCIQCICTWFVNHEQTCTYCKKSIEWEKCNKIYCDYDKIIADHKQLLNDHKTYYETINNTYINTINKFNK